MSGQTEGKRKTDFCRRSAGIWRRVTVLVMIAVSVLTFTEARAEGHGLCPDDELVVMGISRGDNFWYYAYDSLGRRLGRIPVNGWGANAKLVKKDLLTTPETDRNSIFRIGDMKVSASYPKDDYWVYVNGSYYFVLEEKTGRVTLYDSALEEVGSLVLTRRIPISNSLYGRIWSFSEEFLLYIGTYAEGSWVWIRKQDGSGYEETRPELLDALNNKDLSFHVMKDFLVFCPYSSAKDKTTGRVLTKDGLMVMDHIVQYILEDPAKSPYDLNPDTGYDGPVCAVCRENEGKYDLYGGSSLDYLGTAAEVPAARSCRNGFYEGLPCPELEGNVCRGFVLDCDTGLHCPCAARQNETLIFKDGRLLRFPVEGIPYKISEAYYVTREPVNVYKVSDGSLFTETDEQYPEVCLSLGSSGLAVNNPPKDPEKAWDITRTLYDNDGNAVYTSGSRDLNAFTNGTWYTTRGIYMGVIDLSGNWILKDTMETE